MLCIAGKNNIAVDILEHCVSTMGKECIVITPNQTDHGADGWQKSLRKASKDLDIPEVSLSSLYDIEGLCFLSLEYDRIIKPSYFKSNNLVNIHFSALPKYRGMYTSCLPIINGESESGVTLHEIDHGIDTGNIIDQIRFNIASEDTARDLYYKYLKYGTMLVLANLHDILHQNYTSYKQCELEASYYSSKTINFNDVSIDFNNTAINIKNQIRAYFFPEYQVPICFQKKISSCTILNQRSTAKPGTLLDSDNTCLTVSTNDFDIELKIFKS